MPIFGNRLHDAVNLTRHDIVVVDDDGVTELLRLKPSGHEARLTTKPPRVGCVEVEDGVRVPVRVGAPAYEKVDFGGYTNGTGPVNIVVSALVAIELAKTMDSEGGNCVWGPDTDQGSVVRDAKGVVVGVKRMVLYTAPV